jgi:hypothetical protein
MAGPQGKGRSGGKWVGGESKKPKADWSSGSGSSGPYIGKRGGKWADPQHKIPWKESKHAGKAAPKEKEHDSHGATELELHIDNTEHLANESVRDQHGERQTQRGAIHRNLARKVAAGNYDHAQAGKLFQYHVDAAAKDYQKQHGGNFDAATRRHVARGMADEFHQNVKDGYHDHHVSSGVHAKRAKAGGGLSNMAEQHGKTKKGREALSDFYKGQEPEVDDRSEREKLADFALGA